MIIGKGMIAKAFSKYENNMNIIIFASGVSNSTINLDVEFKREHELLLGTIAKYPNETIVYFSTCSVYDPELSKTAYVCHKRKMEKLIQKNCKKYYIFRLPQVVGITTNSTLVNFIVNKIKNNETLTVWKNSTRNLIDVDDVFKIAQYLIENNFFINETTNIALPFSLSILNIVSIVEELSRNKAHYTIENRGGSYEIDTSKIGVHLKNIDVSFFENYSYSIIKKYFF